MSTDGQVSAIIDWDQAYLAPHAWEVIRTVHLVFTFDVGVSRAFLGAYHAAQPLPWAALDAAAAAYSTMRTLDLWVYRWIYDRGDDRTRQYLTDDGFAAVWPQWSGLKARMEQIEGEFCPMD